MIYHTAADPIYFDFFFKRWHQSIRKFQPNANFSLRYVGPENQQVLDYCSENNILLSVDSITLPEIAEKFNVDESTAKGYYALARWISIPNGEDVCVTDIDIIQLNPLGIDFEKISTDYSFASIARKKVDHPNMMMCLYISKDKIQEVKNKANNLLSTVLRWDTDTAIMTWISKNYPIYLDLGLFKLDSFPQKNVPEYVKFGYFSSKPFLSIIDKSTAEIKKIKYDLLYERTDGRK